MHTLRAVQFSLQFFGLYPFRKNHRREGACYQKQDQKAKVFDSADRLHLNPSPPARSRRGNYVAESVSARSRNLRIAYGNAGAINACIQLV